MIFSVSGVLGRSSRTLSAMKSPIFTIQSDGLWMLHGCCGATFKGRQGAAPNPRRPGYPSLRMDFTSLMGQLSPAGITRTFPPAPISA